MRACTRVCVCVYICVCEMASKYEYAKTCGRSRSALSLANVAACTRVYRAPVRVRSRFILTTQGSADTDARY